MCRQETTVGLWVGSAVKDKHQATELRPVSAGQHHPQPCSLHQAWGGGVGHTRRGIYKQHPVMQDLPTLIPGVSKASHCGCISKC